MRFNAHGHIICSRGDTVPMKAYLGVGSWFSDNWLDGFVFSGARTCRHRHVMEHLICLVLN